MVNPSFDSGILLVMLAVGFIPLSFYKKLGAILLVISVFSFSIIGVLILTGYDVVSFRTTTDGTNVFNETSYFIGNGSQPSGTGQLWMGFAFLILATIIGAVCLDQATKGNLFISG
jgi:hypothetical protein